MERPSKFLKVTQLILSRTYTELRLAMVKTTASYEELNNLSRLHLCIYFSKNCLYFWLLLPPL